MKQSGDEIIQVKEQKILKGMGVHFSFEALFGHIKAAEKIRFAHNLGSMLEAGLPLTRALAVSLRQSRNKAMTNILADLIAEINRGSTFSESLKKYPRVFPDILISMVHAGEQSGTLSESLKSAAAQMENSSTLERRVRGALMYPAVIVSVMIIIAILMMIFVVPTLLKTFTDLHVQLPATTQAFLSLSNLIQSDGLLVLIVLAIVAGSFYVWSRRDAGKKIIHLLLLRMPVIGSLIQEVNVARTARTLSSLMNSGVEVVESVEITSKVVQNVHFRNVLKSVGAAIAKGDLMSKVFAEHAKLYTDFFVEMLAVGEETGKIGDMLMEVALFYEDDIDQKTKNMSTMIEPILMVVIGGAVGLFAVSMITPMYSLVSAV